RQCGGIPIFNTDARVLDPDSLAELGAGEVGEIVVHGPQVFKGYWKQDEATRQAFIEHDGKRFFRTGDLGYYDDEGYFFITDRLKRMINASGFKVWPAEVEAMLYAHPGIQEACVIGAPDGYRGETVKALIVPRPGAMGELRAEDIIEWARARMQALDNFMQANIQVIVQQDRPFCRIPSFDLRQIAVMRVQKRGEAIDHRRQQHMVDCRNSVIRLEPFEKIHACSAVEM